MMKEPFKTCSGCKQACFIDYGYSNYTVEGTEFYCGKALHPDKHFDRFYGEDKRLYYAQWCTGYEAGEFVEMDVEKENLSSLTVEQRAIYNACMTQS